MGRWASLPPRLAAVAEQVPPGARFADVGTDHGHLPRALLDAGRVPRAIAMDISPRPLDVARTHLAPWPEAELRLGSGLIPLKAGEADAVAICGMGSVTMVDILTARDPASLGISRLILQPQGDLPPIRQHIEDIGHHIADEHLVADHGRLYLVIVAEPGARAPLSEADLILGPVLRARGGPLYDAWLEVQRIWWRSRLKGLGERATAADHERLNLYLPRR